MHPVSSVAHRSRVPRRGRSGVVVALICFSTIVFDGYDLIVYGVTVPSLLDYDHWDLTPLEAGLMGSYGLIGMLVGTLVIGTVTDIVGRRRIMLFCIMWFSIAMCVTSFASDPQVFGILRFVTGLGLGGTVATSIALTVEYAPAERKSLYNALMYSGYSVGGIAAAVVGVLLLPESGFRVMYALGGTPLITILPLAYFYLPESVAYLRQRGRNEEAADLSRKYSLPEPATDTVSTATANNSSGTQRALRGVRTLFGRQYLLASLMFSAASFFGLLLIYGLNTWLPQIMRAAGYPLGSSLSFVVFLNVGSIIGTVAIAFLADRIGIKAVASLSFMGAAVAICMLSLQMWSGFLFVLVAVAGVGTIGTQILVNGFIATYYPAAFSATALGWILAFGRLGAVVGPVLGGLIASSGLDYRWNFYIFGLFAAVGVITIASVPNARARDRV